MLQGGHFVYATRLDIVKSFLQKHQFLIVFDILSLVVLALGINLLEYSIPMFTLSFIGIMIYCLFPEEKASGALLYQWFFFVWDLLSETLMLMIT